MFDISLVEECRQEGMEMFGIIFFSPVVLFNEDFAVLQPMVESLPGLVGPCEAEWEIGLARSHNLIERTF